MQALETPGYTAEMNQFLTFRLGEEEYGIDILKVQEIRGYSAITHIPNAPPHVKGIINLRGTVVPVVDLRAKFSMDAVEYTKFTVIVVAMVGEKIAGLIVDAVSDVLNIAANDVRPAPDLGARCDTRFIRGVASISSRLAVLLEIDRLLTEEETAVNVN